MSGPSSLPVALKPYLHTATGKRVFGLKRFVNGAWTSEHNGVDFAVPVGLPLESGIRGRVSLVGGSLTHSWGYYIHIICDCPLKHVQEFHVLQSRPNFNVGDRIEIGQVVAKSGSSGSFNGVRYAPHHHHGTSENGKYYNPLTIGWPSGASDSHQPLDNTEDEMTPEQFKYFSGELEIIKSVLAINDGGGMRQDLRNVASELGGTRATLNNVEQIIGGPGGIANNVAAIFTMVGSGGTGNVEDLAAAIASKLPQGQAATKQDIVDALSSLTFKAV